MGEIKFGSLKTYTSGNIKYPAMWGNNDRNWEYKNDKGKITEEDKECLLWETEKSDKNSNDLYAVADENTVFKQSNYAHDYNNGKKEFKNMKYDELIKIREKGSGDYLYWLAGRCTILKKSSIVFSIQCISHGGESCYLYSNTLYDSNRRW